MTSAFEGRRVLVTGAGGFIGSHLAERLAADGAAVRCLLRYTSTDHRGELLSDDVEVHRGDLRDPESVDAAVAGAEIVFHLGALVAIPFSYLAPRQFVETNVTGTLNVLTAARRHGVELTVCTSTSEVYGTPERIPVAEGDRLRPQSPYAASKVAADALALSFHRSFGLAVSLARPFNAYGPRQSARAVIPTILTQALAHAPVRLGSLHPVRDFTFVDDTVAGLLALASHPASVGRVIHIGSGRGVGIGELVDLVGDVVGRDLGVEHDDRRVRPAESEVERLVCDATIAEQELGWRPSVPIREGLERTASWVAAHLDHYRPDVYAI